MGSAWEELKTFTNHSNIMIGTAYSGGLLENLDGNFAMAAAAYNAGPHRARRWQASDAEISECGSTLFQ